MKSVPHHTSRRGMLATLLAMGMWPGARAAETGGCSASAIRFVSLNDPHHEDEGCDAWMEALFRQVAGTPDATLCFALGDLANSGKLKSLETIQRLSVLTEMPFYPCPGNHDLDESPADGFYESIFPGRRNYVVKTNGWQLVVIDTTEGTKYQKTTVSKTTLDWLDATLPDLDARAPTVLLTHFPLASELQYCPLNAEDVLARFTRHNLRGVFGGHFHGRTRNVRGDLALQTCACVSRVRNNHDGSAEKGYFVVDGAADGSLRSEFVEFGGI